MPVRTLRRVVVLAALIALVVSLVPGVPHAAPAGAPAGAASTSAWLDVRRPVAPDRALAASAASARADLAPALGRHGVLELDPRTGTVRVVARLDGFLTRPSPTPPDRIALGFVTAHLDAFGLAPRDLRTFVLARDHVDLEGTHHLSWVQRARGIEAFDNGLKASVTADGQLVTISGSPARGLGAEAPITPGLSAGAAIGRARTAVGAPARAAAGDTASLVWFHGGRSRLAWRTFTNVSDDRRDLSVVDAQDGRVLWRANMVRDAVGTGLAWQYHPGSGVPNGGGTQVPVTFPVSSDASLAGANAYVYLDLKDDSTPGAADQIPSLGGLDWSAVAQLRTNDGAENCSAATPCTWDMHVPSSWSANKRQNAVQVYWFLNQFHDHLLAPPIGFGPAAGNFEGQDRVKAEVLDGAAIDGGLPDPAHYNNANMFTPPDGRAPVMQLYLFRQDAISPGWTSANAGDDASVVYHEYTHGLSSRLVTYPNGTQALNAWQSGAMGEGWSDFYAMDLLVERGVVTDTSASGEAMVGVWITGGEGIRTQAIDCAVGAPGSACPGAFQTGTGGFTYGDYGRVYGFPEVHGDGEIWAQTLWDLRAAVGTSLARRLITRAMELSPPEPSFLDMRNAIIQADLVATGGANAAALWTVFRARGMGYFASVVDGNDVTPVQNSAAPPSCASSPCGSIRGRITDSVTLRPVPGVRVTVGGHGGGFPGTGLSDTTDAEGRYAIAKVPFFTYPDVVIDRWGIEPVVLHGVAVDGTETIDRKVVRNWAALDGGAKLGAFTPPDYTAYGCGPSRAFDRSLATGWGSDAPGSTFGSPVTGPRSVVVQLPRAVRVTAFGIDPGTTCGDGPAAAVKAFDISTRTATGPWVLAYRNVTALPQGVLTRLVPTAGTNDVRYVRLTMRSNRGDPQFMDMSELSVRGR